MNNREFDRCMRRMQKGDKTGLKEIYEAYISYIYAVIRGVVKNNDIHPNGQRLICCRICAISALE